MAVCVPLYRESLLTQTHSQRTRPQSDHTLESGAERFRSYEVNFINSLECGCSINNRSENSEIDITIHFIYQIVIASNQKSNILINVTSKYIFLLSDSLFACLSVCLSVCPSAHLHSDLHFDSNVLHPIMFYPTSDV